MKTYYLFPFDKTKTLLENIRDNNDSNEEGIETTIDNKKYVGVEEQFFPITFDELGYVPKSVTINTL